MTHLTRITFAAGPAAALAMALAMALPGAPAHAHKPEPSVAQPYHVEGTVLGMARGPERHDEVEKHRSAESYRFTERDRHYIQDWYDRNLPPGLAKQGKIPPGHAKRLSRGEPWPPRGLEYERLPRDLVRQLHPLPDHLRYYRVGTDVIIADMAGQVVADVIYDVLNR